MIAIRLPPRSASPRAALVEPSGLSRERLAEARLALARELQDQRRYLLAVAQRELACQLRPKVSADDLVQETFLRAQRHLAVFGRGDPRRCRAWLRRVLRNQLRDAHRRYCRTSRRSLFRETSLTVDDLAAVDLSATEHSANQELREWVEQLLTNVSRRDREILRLRHWESCSFVEIGLRLGRSPDAARKLWVRAIRQLRERVQRGTLNLE